MNKFQVKGRPLQNPRQLVDAKRRDCQVLFVFVEKIRPSQFSEEEKHILMEDPHSEDL